MTDQIREQLILFGAAMYTGVVMAFVYDLVRIFRIIRKSGVVWIWIQDLIYWMSFGYVTYAMFLEFNYGGVRSYGFFGIIIGMATYFATISRFFVKYISMILIKIINTLTKALKILFKPFKLGIRCTKNTASKVIIWLRKTTQSMRIKKAQQREESVSEEKQDEEMTTEG